MKTSLGKLKYVSVRDVWKTESGDFTPWLAKPENMEKLGDAIGINFGPAVPEISVGQYRADIFTTEMGRDSQKVIIENQYGQTDHDHLGKIITYSSGKKANIVIWVAESASMEHKNAIKWLNERTDEDVEFFLVEMKLVQIDNSKPAPIFHIIEGPNICEKNAKQKKHVNAADKSRLVFWENFVNYASSSNGNFFETFSKRKISPKYYYDLTFNDKRYHFFLTNSKKYYSISVYMQNQKELYYKLQKHAKKIEQEIGAKLIWEEFKKACTIQWIAPKDLKTSGDVNLQKVFDWFIAAAFKYKEVFAKYAK